MAVGSVQGLVAGSTNFIRESNSDDVNYAIPNQTLSSFTLEDSKKTPNTGSNFIRTFKGCIVDTFNLTLSEGEVASVELGYKAQSVDFSSGAITAVTPRTTKPYMWSDVSIHLPSGTKLTNVTEYSFTVNNNLESRFPLNGSRTVEEIIPLNRDYEVTASFIMDTANAKTLYDQYYIGGSSFNSMIEMKAVAGSAYFIMSGCRITEMEVPSPVEGLQDQTATIMPKNVAINVYDSIGSYTF